MWVLINCVFQKNQPILSRLTNVWTLNCSYYSFILLLISIGSAPLSFLILVIFVFFFVLVCLARGPSILLIFPKNHLLILLISCFQFYWFLFKKFTFRGEGRQKERERNINVWMKHWLVASCTPPAGDLAHNPGMYPDWELNKWPFTLQNDTQSTEPHQSGPILLISALVFIISFVLL